MPFDGSGNFTRVHDWTDDRDNGINILASRMDAEMDDYAVAFNMMFFRNGLVPMSGNLNMGTNRILALAAGSLGTYPIVFNDDATTGFYLNGAGKFAVGVSGVKRGEFTSAGFDVVGAVTTTGNISIGGTGTFSNDVTILRATTPALRIANSAAGASEVIFSLDAGNTGLGVRDSQIRGGNNGSNQTYLDFYTSGAALPAHAMRIDSAGKVGIGVSVPTSKLDVRDVGGPSGATRRIASLVDISGVSNFLSTDAVVYVQNGGAGDAGVHFRANTADYSIRATDSGELLFEDDNVERMRIAADGKVGIGVNSPAEALDIAGNFIATVNGTVVALLRSGDTTNYSALRLRQTATESRIENIIAGTGSYVPLTMHTSGSERVRVDASGQVGIGVTSPGGILHVAAGSAGGSSTSILGNASASTTTGTGARLYLTGANNVSRGTYIEGVNTGGGNNAHDLVLATNAGSSTPVERMRITSAGVIQDSAGLELGYRDAPQVIKSAAFTFASSDRGKHIYYNGAAAAATINPNSTTAIPIGAAITVVNDGTGNLTITRGAAVALIWENADANRILAPGGIATIVKVGTDRWFISGNNLS